jgi:hypothetical protein
VAAWEDSPNGSLGKTLGAQMTLGHLQRAKVVARAVERNDGRDEDDGRKPKKDPYEKREPGFEAKKRPREPGNIRPPSSPRYTCR